MRAEWCCLRRVALGRFAFQSAARLESADGRQVVRTGMKQDWSWDRSAAEYEHLSERLLTRGR
jgi:glycogen synthase